MREKLATYMGPKYERNIVFPLPRLASLSLLACRQQAQGRTPLPFSQAELWKKVCPGKFESSQKLGFGSGGRRELSFLRNQKTQLE